MVALPTTAVGAYTDGNRTFSVGTPPVLQVIASANDATYVHTTDNTTNNATARFDADAMPSDFGTMDTLSVRLRYHWQTGTQVNTWNSLRARVFKADGVTPLTNEVIVASSITTTTPTNSSVIAFTGVDTSATKDDWDGAILFVEWYVTKNKGGDTLEKRVTAAELTGTYTAGVPEGVLTQTLDPVVGAASGTLTISGVSAATLASVEISATGELAPLAGTWAAETETWDTRTGNWDGSGGLSPIEGVLSQSVGAVALATEGALLVSGTLAQNVGAVAISAEGALTIEGEVGVTISPVVVSAAGTLALEGVLAQSVGTVGFASTGEVSLSGALSQTIEDITLDAAGTLAFTGILGVLAQDVGDVGVSSEGALALAGEVSASLGLVGLSSAGVVALSGAVSQTLPAVGLSAEGVSGAPPIEGVLSATLAPVGLSTTGEVHIQGEASVTLAPVALSAEGVVTLEGLLARTVGAILLDAEGIQLTGIVGSLNTSIGAVTLMARGALQQYVSPPPNTPLSQRIPINQFQRPRGNPFIRAWRTGW